MSVLLPYRDAGPTLGEAVASVLAEEVPLELLAVDDGSMDDGPEMVGGLAERDARVVPLATGGRGLVAALGLAVEHAQAPFLARMDADDVSLPGRLAAQVAAMEADARLGAVGTRVEPFPEAGEGMRRYFEWQNGLVTAEEHARDLFVESPLCHPSAMIRREALDAVGGYRDGDFPEDYDLWLRLAEAGWKLGKVPRVLFRWRQHPRQLTVTDPRYGLPRMRAVKAPFLAKEILRRGRPVVIWGAGATGKRLARELEQHGVRAERFVDIDPRKIGSTARGAPIVAPEALAPPGAETIVIAVGARGARDLVRAVLDRHGYAADDSIAAS